MRAIVTFTLIMALALLIPISTVMAISVEPVSYEQTLANAEMIIVGTITDIHTRWHGSGESMIATDYTIRLDLIAHHQQALFGPKSVGETIVLTFAGGAIGERWVAVPGNPEYELGEQAVFFIDGDDITAFSPLVGAIAGDYRVSDEGFVTNARGQMVDRTFFAGGIDKTNGFSVEEFVAEIKRALPYAEADKSLLFSNRPTIPDDIKHLVFTGDQIPMSTPILSGIFSGSYEVSKPQVDPASPEMAPVPEDMNIFEMGPDDFDDLVIIPQDKYAFLWGPPDRMSTFNIPPIYYSGTPWGLNFEYNLSDWNRYSTLFNKYTTSDNQFGHNGRNDFAFTTSESMQAAYGFGWGSTTLARAVMFNSAGDFISTGQKIYEADIVCNVAKSWTVDWSVGYTNCSVWFFRSTVIHEAGHCFGREHQFTADPAATYNGVMNYPPCGAIDTEFWIPFVDDPESIRAAYPNNINAISDLGVEFFRTAGGGGSSGIPVVWSTFNSSVVAGQTFSMNNFIIENLGTTTMTPAIGWYLTPAQQDYTNSIYLGATTHNTLGTFAYWNTSRTITVPSGTPAGQYYIAAAIQSDGNDWNRSCWTNTKITVTCPQVATPTGLTGTAGCGYIDLDWSNATNATSYRVYRDGTFLTTVTGSAYRDNSPGASQRCYRVAGQNYCDLSSQSSQVCRTALAVPPRPTGLSCTPGCGYIDVSWNASSGATSYRVYRGTTLLSTVTGTSYRDNSPGSSQQCYTIRAGNACGFAAATSQSCCTALTIPASVAGMSCTPGCGFIDVSWAQASGATSYYLYRDGALLTTTAGTSYRDNNPGSSQVCYAVRAANSCGLAPAIGQSCCAALQSPPALTALNCTPGCGKIALSWSASAGATVYRIERDGVPFSSTAATSWQDNSPGAGQRCYTVTAENACGPANPSPEACCTALSTPAPPVDVICAPDCGTILLDWPAVDGATGYRVYRDGAGLASISGTTYMDDTPGNAERCYHVTAINDCGESGNSDRVCCTALDIPAPPASLTCTPDCGSIQLDWPASDGATAYRVYRDGAGLASITGTGYLDDSPGNSERCYTVTAANDCGESGNSDRACCTALDIPAVVTGLQATTTHCDSVKLRWTAVAGALGYGVYRDGAFVASVSSGVLYTDIIGPGCYEYTIVAKNDCGLAPASDRATGCSVCDEDFSISGNIVYYDMVRHVPNVTVDLTGAANAVDMSDAAGAYGFAALATGNYQVTPSRGDNDGGVSVGDIIKVRRHLAFIDVFDSPYKLLAADVNCGGTVSVSDIIKMRRYLAHLESLPCGNWVFVDSSFAINNANWATAPNSLGGGLTFDWTDSSFVAVRLGDVNNTWAPPGPAIADGRNNPTQSAGNATVSVSTERDAIAGDLVQVQVEANSAGSLSGVELHLNYSIEELTFINVFSVNLSNFTENGGDGEIHLVWDDLNSPVDATDAALLFTISFRVNSGMTDSGEIGIDGEIVDIMGNPYSTVWQSGYVVMASPAAVGSDDGLMPGSYYLSANYPNPFNPETHIEFGLPQAEHVSLCVYNVMGQRVACLIDRDYGAGIHQVTWNGRDDAGHLVGSGVYFYRLEAGSYMQTRKMTLMK